MDSVVETNTRDPDPGVQTRDNPGQTVQHYRQGHGPGAFTQEFTVEWLLKIYNEQCRQADVYYKNRKAFPDSGTSYFCF
jgi:hypothetical protein